MRSRGARLFLTESVEDIRQKFPVDTDASIGHDDVYLIFRLAPCEPHRDASPLRELDRVRHQVPDNLLKTARIAEEHRTMPIDLDRQLNPFSGGRSRDPIRGVLHNLAEVYECRFDPELPGQDS